MSLGYFFLLYPRKLSICGESLSPPFSLLCLSASDEKSADVGGYLQLSVTEALGAC